MCWVRRAAGAATLATVAAVAGVAGAAPAVAATPQLTRAAYLTDVVGTAATVNWGTDSTGVATVTYGPVTASCTGATANGTATPITVATRSEQQWTAHLTGLAPSTSYCYQITQDGTPLLATTPHFTSAIGAGASGGFSFAVLGDWGEATNGVNTDQQKVLELVAKSGVNFALGTGDIGYGDASQTDYGDLQNTGGNSEVFRSGFWGEPGGSVPMFSAIGNHGFNATFLQNWPQPSAVSSSGGSYSLDAAGDPTAWYAFDEGTTRFYVLEAAAPTASTQYADDDSNHWASNSPQVTWLKNDLAAHPGTLKLAVFHYPLWSDDGSDSDTMLRADLLPILDQYGVRMVFNGHSHIYERNNPYTGGSVNGLVSYVSGGAGADTEDITQCSSFDAYAIGWSTSGTSCHAAPPTSVSQVHHFLKVTVNGTEVSVTPTDENGNVFDEQTYDFAPSAPTGMTATAGVSHVALSWTAPSSNGGSAVTGYTVFRATSPGAAGSAIASGVATPSYDDTTAAAATTYYYSVRATNAAGLSGPQSSVVGATAYAVPDPPSGVTATPANSSVHLTWSAPSGNGSPISSYTVYRSTDGSRGNAIATPTTTTFDDTGLTNGATYYYTVTATNAAGQGPDSSQVSTSPRAVPDAVAGLTATPGDAAVSLTWTPPTNTGGSAVTSYDVYRSTDGSRGSLVATPTSASFDDSGLANGTTYYYTVAAVNTAGEGAGVQQSAAPRTKPTAPTGLAATPQNSAIALSWSAPANDGGAAVTSYTVFRSTTSSSRGVVAATTTGTTFTDTGLTNGTTYYYVVTATNTAGEGPGSSQASAAPRGVPDAPSSVTASPSNATVGLTWTAPPDNGNPISGYTVYRSTDGSRGGVVGTPAGPSFTDTGLGNGTTYYYTVTATNAAGEGPGSATTAATPHTTPTAPVSVTATPGNESVSLAWAAPADDGGAPLAGYHVYRSTDGSRGSLVASPASPSFTDTGLGNGTTYYYTVTATNAAGEGPGSGQASASPASAPAAPMTLSAGAGDRRAELSWAPPPDDGGRAVTSYRVYRSTDGGASWTSVATTATTSWTDGTVTDGVTYEYAVSAVNAVGESVRSAQVTVMPHGGATVTISSGPRSPSNSSTATFSFETADPNGLAVTTTCSLDGAPAVPCSTGQTFAGLADGRHSVTVTSGDATGPGGDAGYAWVVDTTAPTAALRAVPAISLAAIVVRWSATDRGAGVSSYDVRYRRAGRSGRFSAWNYPGSWQRMTATTVTRSELRGYTDCFAVRAHDLAGNVSAWTRATCTARPLDDRALAAGRGWTKRTGGHFYVGTVSATTRYGATLTTRDIGARRLGLVATTCDTCGVVRVYVAGHLVGTVSLRASRTTRRALVWLPAFSRRTGVLTIQVATSGRLIQIDGVAAIP